MPLAIIFCSIYIHICISFPPLSIFIENLAHPLACTVRVSCVRSRTKYAWRLFPGLWPYMPSKTKPLFNRFRPKKRCLQRDPVISRSDILEPSVVLPPHNGGELLKTCLNGLAAMVQQRFQRCPQQWTSHWSLLIHPVNSPNRLFRHWFATIVTAMVLGVMTISGTIEVFGDGSCNGFSSGPTDRSSQC
jgi:hypothetical protein